MGKCSSEDSIAAVPPMSQISLSVVVLAFKYPRGIDEV